MKRPARVPLGLSESIHRRLNAYALAASAAGVSVLALANNADARIVYTRAHVVLGAGSNAEYWLDVNHDGVKDLSFVHAYFFSVTTGFFTSGVEMRPYKGDGNNIMGVDRSASALPAGAKIGPSGHFSGSNMAAAGGIRQASTSFGGAWANDGKGLKNRYLGLRFAIKGKHHFGWARVTVSPFPFTATLTGYAYETIANKPIIAGREHGDSHRKDEATLGRLAQAHWASQLSASRNQ